VGELHSLKIELVHPRNYTTRAEAQRFFAFHRGLLDGLDSAIVYRPRSKGAKSRLNPLPGKDHHDAGWVEFIGRERKMEG
jgi:hypothetical protein